MGFGCMGLTGGYNPPLAEENGIAILIDAFNKGITFFDTADVYGSHANEVLVGKVHVNAACQSMNPVHCHWVIVVEFFFFFEW